MQPQAGWELGQEPGGLSLNLIDLCTELERVCNLSAWAAPLVQRLRGAYSLGWEHADKKLISICCCSVIG